MNFDPNNRPESQQPDIHRELPDLDEPKIAKKDKIITKTLIIVVASLLIAGGIGFGLYNLFLKKDAPQPAPLTTQPAIDTPPAAKDVPDATTTKLYENGQMGLKLTYPDTWVVTPTADRGVRVESPTFTYASLEKASVSGQFRIYIRKGARPADGKTIGRGVAIQPSEKLVYTNPALDQRKDTLLSLFGLDTKDNFGFFMIAGNFQLNAGDTLGPDYGKEADAYIVSGGYSSTDLIDDMATNAVAISTLPTSNAYKQAVDILKTLQLR